MKASEKNLVLMKSEFGTGYLLGGVLPVQSQKVGSARLSQQVLLIRSCHAIQKNFLEAEVIGTEVEKRCKSCKNCKECSFKAVCLSWAENQELMKIEAGLSLDEKEKKWTAEYPYLLNPEVMKDNKGQAMACLTRLENQLIKKNELQAFKEQFEEAVDRGVFKKLTEEELKKWTGPVNYISMVVAYKEGAHSTTPLRICLNSAMKQPSSKKSFNDLLMKGLSALTDLYEVTLGHREFVFALAADIKKLYNGIKVDLITMNLRRILWRDGQQEKEPDTYITTTVAFGDKPAGCIAITAVRETAKRYQHLCPQAAWFIQNRAYVDDLTGGADSLEELEEIGLGMKKIIELGGFTLKETIKSGDPVKDLTNLRKILGIKWDTEKDRLLLDVKVNFSDKRRGARICPDVDLSEIEAHVPKVITKRLLWRVSMTLFDPLGLASVFLIRLNC
jgi:hypothetical protein